MGLELGQEAEPSPAEGESSTHSSANAQLGMGREQKPLPAPPSPPDREHGCTEQRLPNNWARGSEATLDWGSSGLCFGPGADSRGTNATTPPPWALPPSLPPARLGPPQHLPPQTASADL